MPSLKNGNGHTQGDFEEIFEGLTRKDQQKLAREAITIFFAGKKMKIGGRIPERLLFKPKYIDMVIDLELPEAVDKIYAAMGDEPPEVVKKVQDSAGVLPSTERVIKVLGQISRRSLAKKFAPGLLWMYFKYCEGLHIG
jgi:hypothetical protein